MDDDHIVDTNALGATTNTTVMITKVHRAPPVLNLDVQSYVMWKKDVEIWQLLTSLPKNKQGLELYISLKQKYKAFIALTIDELSSDDGVKLILRKLDELLLRDKDTLAYEAFEQFDQFRKKKDVYG